jgi:hypothetical protein
LKPDWESLFLAFPDCLSHAPGEKGGRNAWSQPFEVNFGQKSIEIAAGKGPV